MLSSLVELLAVSGLALLAAGRSKPADGCRAERVRYLGWDAWKLTNGLITLHVVPSIGGRVIQFELGDHPFFAIHPKWTGMVVPPAECGFGSEWRNYGGDKIWPAPQGWQRDDQWPGPPDPVFDAGPYSFELLTDTSDEIAVRLTSGSDSYTGVQLGRVLRIFRGSTRVAVESFMRNLSRQPVRWSIWEVSQLDARTPDAPDTFEDDFWAYCPVNPRSCFPAGYHPMFGLVNHPSFSLDPSGRLLRVHYRYQVGKVGLDSTAGWLAAVNRRTRFGFFETFQHVPGVEYPDHSSVEFWLHGPGDFINNQEVISMPPDSRETPYLMESEILSPLVTLAPGEEYGFRLSWYAGRTGGPVWNVNAVGAVHEPLEVSGAGEERTIAGRFAVFHVGRLAATFYATTGTTLGTEVLTQANPLEELVLNQRLRIPHGTYRLSLRVENSAGESLGTLAELVLAN
jgi:hypothetical protein